MLEYTDALLSTNRICIFVALYFFAPVRFRGVATYYLDPVNGNDNNPGTSGAPWQSIQHAQGSVTDGDTVLLASGNYGDVYDSARHGDFVTWAAMPGAGVDFNALVVENSAFLHFDSIRIHDGVSAFQADHFELINCDVAFDGDPYGTLPEIVDIGRTTNSVVRDCQIHNGNDGINAEATQNVTITGNHIYRLVNDGISATPTQGALIADNDIHDLNQDHATLKDYWTTWGFSGTGGVSVQDIPQDSLIINNSGTTGTLAYYNFSSPVSFANMNFSDLTITTDKDFNQGELAIRLSTQPNGSTGGLYRDFPIFACPANGQTASSVDIDGTGLYQVISVAIVANVSRPCNINISDWDFSNGAHQDYCVISGSDITIRNNVFHDGATQGIFTSPSDAANVTIENNLIYDLAGSTFMNVGLTGSSAVRNNTLIGSLRAHYEDQPRSPYYFNGLANISADDGGANLIVCNNLVLGELTPDGARNSWNIVQFQTGLAADNYSVSQSGGGLDFEGTNFFADHNYAPRNRGIFDYQLVANSPAVNFGDPAVQPADSLGSINAIGCIVDDGPARNQDHHSAGARETTYLGNPNYPPLGQH
jgi:hypothetical protein